MNKIRIKTGLYSDFARDVFNDVQKYVQTNGDAINACMLKVLLNPTLGTATVENYQFQHFDDGEVVLCEPRTFQFASTFKNVNTILALQLKAIVCELYTENVWKRHDLNASVTLIEKSYLVGELYFIYDFLLNHRQSVNVFKRIHPQVAAKILGVPRDPIASEVQAMIRKNIEDAYAEHKKAIHDLQCWFPTIYGDTPAERELKARIEPIMNAFKAELENKRKALNESLAVKLAEIEKLKQM